LRLKDSNLIQKLPGTSLRESVELSKKCKEQKDLGFERKME
jgi:hypothetical protein